jgi:hypothetical protein
LQDYTEFPELLGEQPTKPGNMTRVQSNPVDGDEIIDAKHPFISGRELRFRANKNGDLVAYVPQLDTTFHTGLSMNERNQREMEQRDWFLVPRQNEIVMQSTGTDRQILYPSRGDPHFQFEGEAPSIVGEYQVHTSTVPSKRNQNSNNNNRNRKKDDAKGTPKRKDTQIRSIGNLSAYKRKGTLFVAKDTAKQSKQGRKATWRPRERGVITAADQQTAQELQQRVPASDDGARDVQAELTVKTDEMDLRGSDHQVDTSYENEQVNDISVK